MQGVVVEMLTGKWGEVLKFVLVKGLGFWFWF